MSIYIVIPAYNESRAIGRVVRGLKERGYHHVVVVDDGSRDSTSKKAKDAGATVLRHIINRGQGAALRTGIEYAVQQKAEVIVTFDADGQHRVEDIKHMVNPVKMGQVEMTLGSRFMSKKSKIPFLKVFALKTGAIFNWFVYGIRLSDAHNGLRAISLSAAKRMEITADKMEHASEILDEIRKKDISYIEIPVKIVYSEYSMQKGQGPWRMVPLGIRIVLRKIMKIL